jgi:hypothetical protein
MARASQSGQSCHQVCWQLWLTSVQTNHLAKTFQNAHLNDAKEADYWQSYQTISLGRWAAYGIMVRFFTARRAARNVVFARYLLMSFYGKF